MEKNNFSFLSLCPLGLINDPYPGQCVRYIDTNKNGFCDYSQTLTGTAVSNNYHLFPILIILTLLYGVSALLVNKKLLDLATHRKIWNVLLLVSFLVCGISGILLILRLNFGFNLPNYAEILFNHVELGIAMAVIAFFHFARHWHYFKNIFKNN